MGGKNNRLASYGLSTDNSKLILKIYLKRGLLSSKIRFQKTVVKFCKFADFLKMANL